MSRPAKWTIQLLSGFGLLALLWAAIDTYRDRAKQTREAHEAIAEFHQRFNASDFDSICEVVFECYRAGLLGAPDNHHVVLGDLRKKQGAFESVIKSSVRVWSEPRWIEAEYVSRFEKGQLKEFFLMRHADGLPVLMIYEPTEVTDTSSK